MQVQRTRRRWLSGLRNPNATRPTCLTMRLLPSVRPLLIHVTTPTTIDFCQALTVRARPRKLRDAGVGAVLVEACQPVPDDSAVPVGSGQAKEAAEQFLAAPALGQPARRVSASHRVQHLGRLGVVAVSAARIRRLRCARSGSDLRPRRPLRVRASSRR